MFSQLLKVFNIQQSHTLIPTIFETTIRKSYAVSLYKYIS